VIYTGNKSSCKWLKFPMLHTVVKICLLVSLALYFLFFFEYDSIAKWATAVWLLLDSNIIW